MISDDHLRALARARIARRLAVEERTSRRAPGILSRALRIEREEWKAARRGKKAPRHIFGSTGTWLPVRPRLGRLPRWTALAGAVAVTPIMALAWYQSSVALAELDRVIACSSTTALLAQDGTILGAIPVDQTGDCQAGRAMLTAPFPPQTTARLADAVAAIEGEFSTASPWVWGGHDIRGVARKLGDIAGLLPGRGASSPLLTAVEATLGEHDTSLWRKLVMAITTTRFVGRSLPDDQTRAAFIVTHMPGTLGGGDPRAGLLAADALFGREPASTLEFCQLARAMGQQVWLVGDAITERAARSWAIINGPATESCIQKTATGPEDEAASLAALRAACGGTELCLRRPALPPGVPASMAQRGILQSLEAIAHERLPRVQPLNPEESVRLASADLMRLSAVDPGGVLQTSIDARLQSALAPVIERELDAIDRILPEGICLTGQCQHRIDHTIIVGELAPDGIVDLRALHLNRQGGIAGWPERDPVTGEWDPMPPRFGLASTGKAVLALVAAEHGLTRLCSSPSGGATCDGGTWIPIKQAVAESLADPHEWLAAEYPEDVTRLQRILGLPGAATVVDPAFDAAYGIGRGAMTPMNAVTLFGAILGGGHSGVRLFEGDTYAEVTLTGIEDSTLAATRDLLLAPLGPDGTLSGIGGALADLGAIPRAAKSGTHTEGVDLVLTETIAISVAGRDYVIFVALTASDPSQGLADLRHADLVNLQTAIVRQLAQ